MSLNLTATLKEILPLQSGQGRNGPWQKQDFIVETSGQYPKKICCTVWGDRTGELKNLQLNQQVTVHFDLESREYNGRWYTDVKVWKFEAAGGAAPPDAGEIPPPDDSDFPAYDEEDLPF